MTKNYKKPINTFLEQIKLFTGKVINYTSNGKAMMIHIKAGLIDLIFNNIVP